MKPTWTHNPDLGCYEVLVDALQCDADGANGQTGGVACYVPNGSGLPSLDYLANGGHPGNWWGLVTDNGEPNGNPISQDSSQPVPGAYISTTSYQFSQFKAHDVNRYVDAAAVKGIVVPRAFQIGVPGIVLGGYCECEVAGHVENGIAYDVGPAFGEASLAMCQAFDPNASAKHGTNIGRCTIRVWPGRAVDGFPLQRG